MKVKDYKELRIWIKGIELVKRVYDLTDEFPNNEMYTLMSQMRRAAVSIPSNIAEGFVRKNMKEYRQFLHVSLGFCAELETQINISKERNYITQTEFDLLIKELLHEMKMILNLIKCL